MRRTAFVALAACLALVAGSCRGSSQVPTAKSPPTTAVATLRDGGTVTVAADPYPTELNAKLTTAAATYRIPGVALARGYLIAPDGSYKPDLFDGDCRQAAGPPFTVSCRIVQNAHWSDGADLTANDFQYTWQVIMNPAVNVATRQGYNKIDHFTIKDAKDFDVVFTQPYPAWRNLFSTAGGAPLPQHALDGTDINTVWKTCVCDPKTGNPIGSGPYLVGSFNKTPEDKSLVLVRNDNYWGTRPKLDTIVFKPVTDPVQPLQTGDVQVISPALQTLGISQQIQSLPTVTYQSTALTSFEHFDMRTDVPGLDDVEVRRAIAQAMPRQQIVDRLVKPAYRDASVLESDFYVPSQKTYQKHWSIYPDSGDVATARQTLTKAGYVAGSDGVFAKGDTALKFTLTYPSGAGSDQRQQESEIIAAQLKDAGIGVTIQIATADINQIVAAGTYQMAVYSFTLGPDPGGLPFFRADAIGMGNGTRLKNQNVTDLVTRADVEPDPAKRADLYNQADDALAHDGISIVPLYQRPAVLAYAGNLVGLQANASVDSFTWNIGEWALKA